MHSKAVAIGILAGWILTAMQAGCSTPPKADPKPTVITVIMETSHGTVRIELNAEKAPISVANFLQYVDAKFFDGTIFHRVIPGFMIQGGGFRPDLTQPAVQPPIKNEAANGLKNLRGTLAMARTGVVDSATAQFFISLADNDGLDYKGQSPRAFGYAVFGRVTEGMDVVDKIAEVRTKIIGPHEAVPVETVTITSIRRAAPANK
ncbi:hypothetical protein LCGC14_1666460 [marine sediment metagenome]|uniref:peptidylprolyl isomerase n=1 Tax=marine sediment metagenome TaxID=412755 RepID=A0A0F9HSH4_9ZZZZ